MKQAKLMGTIAAAALAFCTFSAAAQDYPNKPIELVVPFGQGGATDGLARLVAPLLERKLGQPVVIINQPGAGGAVGLANLKQEKPDGYTFGIGSDSTLAARPIMDSSMYTADDFETVARMVEIPSGVAVSADSPYKSLTELVEALRKGERLTWTAAGIGSGPHLAMAVFLAQNNLKATYINSESGPAGSVKLLSGEVDFFSGGGSNYPPMFDKDKSNIRVLGLAAEKRWQYLPDVPTYQEQGFDYLRSQWFGLVAPKGTPPEVIDKVSAALKEALDDPTFNERLKQYYFEAAYLGPKEFRAAIEEAGESIRPILEESGLVNK
ncbi:hypothetical protein GCM10007276_05200 [Agaricicola taiwanensis]|uniref:Tripartite tricarboxylate transporter substrate binding protein n=1 Tax=Agaricicola taiwanensis TaxID=591372 RepID=A0A8J2VHR6_9RHOB|nr:tripartite tricarboxylate transporter substrate binding protein [Agaricicola taiwanensis]GGE30982.1 hypothetical protein GCM10007276_05200 [Agaricicola taiwanensis]